MKRLALLLLAALLSVPLAAQSDPCPGFRNTTNFNTGSTQCFWSARVGERVYTSQDSDTTTGYYVMSTCADPNAPAITGHANITSPSHNSGTDRDSIGAGAGGGIHCCQYENLWDANGRRFQIITQANAGIDQLTVNPSVPGSGMPRIPPGYTSSIRLGDPRSSGHASQSHSWSTGTNKGAEALFYTMRVTAQNALLFVNYAVVGRCYNHQTYQAGEFLIRVVKQNPDGTWPNQPINDSLWFKVSAPPIQGANPVQPWLNGRPGSTCSATTCAYVYKPWAKVAINLNNYMYQNVRVEMYTSDCIYDWDPLYAYIAGDYSPMLLRTSGCPDPRSSVIDTIKAPADMISYQWFVSTGGAEEPDQFYNQSHMDSVHFRQVYPTTTGQTTTDSLFTPTIQHFIVTEGPNAGDTVTEKTFLCIMTSAMDPNKPFQSKLYANVTNTRPLVHHRYTALCDGTVKFQNASTTFGFSRVAEDLTTWEIFTDQACTNQLATVVGDSAQYQFSQPGNYTVRLTCHSYIVSNEGDSSFCSASETFGVRALGSPQPALSLNKHILCDEERLFGRAINAADPTTPLSYFNHLEWTVGDSLFTDSDVDTILLTLPYGNHAVVLTATNADGCSTTVTDTVHVYGAPTVSMAATVGSICVGDTVILHAEGNARYVWSSTPNDSSLASQQGQSTIYVTPRTTTVYTLEPVQENPCSTEGANILVEVVQTPVPQIWFNATSVGIDNPTVNMTDISNDRARTEWHFSDGLSDEGVSVSHTCLALDADSVTIRMTTCNRLECCADTIISLPVHDESIWFPSIFTPGSNDENDHFRIMATFPLLQFEFYVYDRQGRLVYTSTDPEAGWDGRDLRGQPCPQGAYVYYYRYSILGIDDYYPGAGTVTLIR